MNKISLFFVGFIILSSFCSFVTVKMLNVPCLIELFLFPLGYYYRRSIVWNRRDLIALVLFVIAGTFIGLLNPLFELGEILQMSRCFFLGGLGFVLLKNNNLFSSKKKMMALVFGVFMGDLANSYLAMKTMLGSSLDREYAVDINIILSVLWPILIVFCKKSKWLLVLLVLVPILCFLSVSRGISTFFVVGIVLSLIFKTLKSPSKIFVSVTFLVIAFFALSAVYERSEIAVRELSPSIHFRLYTKVKSYGKTKGDGGRIAPYVWLSENYGYYALPRGFLGKKFIKEKNSSLIPVQIPWDSAYFELIYTFGLIPFLLFLIIYLYKLYQIFIYYNKTGEAIFAIACVMFLLLLIEHFFGYGMYRSPFTVFCNGALLGFIWRISGHPETLYGNLIEVENTDVYE